MSSLGRCLAFIFICQLLLSNVANAQEFKPFAVVKEACPECPRPDLDKIKLKNGQTVLAVIVAENSAFYVVQKYSELRAIGRDQVDDIERSETAIREKGYDDQILLKNGQVFSGKILKENAANGMFEIQVPPYKTILYIYKPVITSVFKAGKQSYPNK
ncbi:MAG: hypothetical protein JW841_02745 [Deltaproteobacteria bacterium]|nr:hypothetical protein [Deltaproteobacteria bacterium]